MPTSLDSPDHGLLRFSFTEGLDTTTREEFEALCEDNPELRVERRSNGELIIDIPTKGFTGARNALLALLLGVWSMQDGGGLSSERACKYLNEPHYRGLLPRTSGSESGSTENL